MIDLQKKPWLRALCAVVLVLLFLTWLLYAMVIWDGRLAWGGRAIWPKSGILPILRRIPEGSFGYGLEKRFQTANNSSGLKASLFLLPLPLLTFTLTALLPEGLGKLFPRAKKLRIVYGVLAGLALCFGLLCTLVSCSAWLDKVLSLRLRMQMRVWHMDLIPFCAGLSVVGWLLPCLLLRLKSWKSPSNMGRDLSVGGRKALLALLLGVLTLVVSALAMAVTRHFNSGAVGFVESLCRTIATSDLAMFVSVVMAATVEEIAFRGVIQRGLRKVLPAWPAVVIASLFFGVWHRNTGQLIYTFLFGLAMGWLYEIGGKLRYTILCHSWENLLVTLCFPVKNHVLFGELHILPKVGTFLLHLPALAAALLLPVVVLLMVLLLRRMNRIGRGEAKL